MNDKIRNHINVIFAAAPKTARAAEMKEELLTNLNDKYEDLLKSGYDSTAAFHIALSGIGDIDELFQACRNDDATTLQRESVSSGNDADFNAMSTKSSEVSRLLIALTAVMIFIVTGICLFSDGNSPLYRFGSSPMIVWLAVGVGLIAFIIAKSVQGGNKTSPLPDKPVMPPDYDSWQQSEISNKRITAGVLALLLGVFGVHKFYLGMTGTGVIVLLSVFFTAFLMAPVASIIGLIEGIIYLTKSDREFYRDYIVQKRAWF